MAKIIVSITHAADNPDKATLGFVVANAGLASAQETIVFLSSEGAFLSNEGYADGIHEEGFKPLKDLLDTFTGNGGSVWVCAPCFAKRALSEDKLIPNATLVGGAKVVEELSQGASCISY